MGLGRWIRRGLTVLVALLAACAPAAQPGDVVLVSVDTLRPDHLGLYGYERSTSPNIDGWFGGGAIFLRSYSTEANTSPSVVSILSGLPPHQHRVRLFYQLVPDEIALLPELLPDAYRTAGFVANIVLTDEAMGIARRFDHYDDHVDERAFKGTRQRVWERNARRTTDAALDWLGRESASGRPLFVWVHYIDPHRPYRPPDGHATEFTHVEPLLAVEGDLRWRGRGSSDPDVLEWVDAYDEEIAFVDGEVGRLLDGYAALRPVDDALLLLTADHGESMREHDLWFSHGHHVYEEVVRVPLLLRGPGVEPGRHSAVVSGIDVVPTLLRFAGAPPPPDRLGFDLRSPEAIPAERVAFAESSFGLFQSHWRAAIQGSRKWMVRTKLGERDVVERRFYDLARDPDETSPSPWLGGGEAPRRLLELSERDPDPGGLPADFERGARLRAPKVSPRVSEEQLEKLRALGYAE